MFKAAISNGCLFFHDQWVTPWLLLVMSSTCLARSSSCAGSSDLMYSISLGLSLIFSSSAAFLGFFKSRFRYGLSKIALDVIFCFCNSVAMIPPYLEKNVDSILAAMQVMLCLLSWCAATMLAH